MPRRHRLDRSSFTRPGTAGARLRRALATLTERAPKPPKVTVAELCRLANVSRNSLYRFTRRFSRCSASIDVRSAPHERGPYARPSGIGARTRSCATAS
jgi:hypothetical protein